MRREDQIISRSLGSIEQAEVGGCHLPPEMGTAEGDAAGAGPEFHRGRPEMEPSRNVDKASALS